MCSDVTMGIHGLETILMLYRGLFVQVILNNAQAWSNLTQTDLKALQTIQLKYIKRAFHAPSSTSNILTFLETGLLPIKNEINIKQLTFLHHILTLPDNDPVKFTYQQQLLYSYPNWANEVGELRRQYNLTETDAEIEVKSKDAWKRLVKKKVEIKALECLNKEAEGKRIASRLCPYMKYARQEYIDRLPPKLARKIFHIRTGTIDLRGVREYTYGENTLCRLCHAEDETVEHVVNNCNELERSRKINNIFRPGLKHGNDGNSGNSGNQNKSQMVGFRCFRCFRRFRVSDLDRGAGLKRGNSGNNGNANFRSCND